MAKGSEAASAGEPRAGGAAGEVFGAFLKLGLTAFGGPIAHLGYFRDEFVVRRRWIDEAGYADLVALCGFLPGPASSQVGFAVGWLRAGPLGALAAWTAFTLPSAMLLVLFAIGTAAVPGPAGAGLLHGLKLVAVAVVAQAVGAMARRLTPDVVRIAIALAAGGFVTSVAGPGVQAAAIAGGAIAGAWLCRADPGQVGTARRAVSRRIGWAALGLFLAIGLAVAALPLVAPSPAVRLFAAFYRAGALVFGGGHVVLPLLEAELVRPGWIGPDAFLAGYGAAQAVPGPLFTVAAYLGFAMVPEPHGLAGAGLALVAIFLPGLLLVAAALPFWDRLRTRPGAQGALRGANAAVVGLLAAALYDPLWTGTVRGPVDAALAVAGLGLLTLAHAPPWLVAGTLAAAGLVLRLP